MARKPTGQLYEMKRKSGTTFAARIRAHGGRHYVTLGRSEDGWSRTRAEEELANLMADVRRGIWKPPRAETPPAEPRPEPTFHEFASEWYARRQAEGLRPRSLEYLRWALSDHLLPHFALRTLPTITVEEVDRYTRAKIAEGRLSNASINKTVEVLAGVLELAVEYELITRNPARGRRRRLPTARPERLFLEPDQVAALLDAAGELDAEDGRGWGHRRAMLATLAYAGLRIGELLALRWRDIELASGSLRVRESKTVAGVRTIDLPLHLRDELANLRTRTRFSSADDFVFATGTGRQDNRNNVRRRVLLRAVERANRSLAETSAHQRLPEGLSPHALRRTYASWLIAEGEDPAYVMQQLGHTDPKLTLSLYAKALRSKRRRTSSAGHPDISPRSDASEACARWGH